MVYTINSKFYIRERRLFFCQKNNIKSLLTRNGIRRAVFMLDSYNQMNFKGFFFNNFIKHILITRGVKLTKLFKIKKIFFENKSRFINSERINTVYCTMADDSSKILLAVLLKMLFAKNEETFDYLFEKSLVFKSTRSLLSRISKHRIRWRIRLMLRAYFFSMRKSRRHFLKSGSRLAKNKKARVKIRSKRRVNKKRYQALKLLRSIRLGWSPSDIKKHEDLLWCRMRFFRRFINQPRNTVKSMYNINIFIREIFSNKKFISCGYTDSRKTASFIDYRVYLIYLDRNYANPFLFFDILCDAVLKNGYAAYSAKTIGYAHLMIGRFFTLVELTRRTKQRSFFISGQNNATINTEFTVL